MNTRILVFEYYISNKTEFMYYICTRDGTTCWMKLFKYSEYFDTWSVHKIFKYLIHWKLFEYSSIVFVLHSLNTEKFDKYCNTSPSLNFLELLFALFVLSVFLQSISLHYNTFHCNIFLVVFILLHPLVWNNRDNSFLVRASFK